MHTLTPVEARAFYRERRAFTQPAAARGGRGARPVGRRAARRDPAAPVPADAAQRRPGGALPVLVYFHGGGWTIGDLDTHDVLCRQLANGSGCAVVVGRLPHGPRAPLPRRRRRLPRRHATGCAARRDALGLDPARLAVGGDSAGGNLAAVVAIAGPRCRRPADRLPAADLSGDRHARAATPRTRRTARAICSTTRDDRLLPRPLHRRRGARPRLARFAAAARRPGEAAAGAGADRRLRPAARRRAGLRRSRWSPPATARPTSASSGRSTASSPWARCIDEANTAVALCAAELARALRR